MTYHVMNTSAINDLFYACYFDSAYCCRFMGRSENLKIESRDLKLPPFESRDLKKNNGTTHVTLQSILAELNAHVSCSDDVSS